MENKVKDTEFTWMIILEQGNIKPGVQGSGKKIFTCNPKRLGTFKTELDMLKDFAEDAFECVVWEGDSNKKCCDYSFEEDDNFCSKCGEKLVTDDHALENVIEFVSYISNFTKPDADGYGDGLDGSSELNSMDNWGWEFCHGTNTHLYKVLTVPNAGPLLGSLLSKEYFNKVAKFVTDRSGIKIEKVEDLYALVCEYDQTWMDYKPTRSKKG